MPGGDVSVVGLEGVHALIDALRDEGYETVGPVVRDGAIVPGPVSGVGDLPAGWHDRQEPGRYRLEPSDSPELFGWAVGPESWKATFFPPSEEMWRARVRAGDVELVEPDPEGEPPRALIGARPCEVAAIGVLDRVLSGGAVGDPGYRRRRADAFVIVVECGVPAATCLCTSMGTGPDADGGFDLALTEILDDRGHRFVARAGTTRGAELLATVGAAAATEEDRAARDGVLEAAREAICRRLPDDDVPALLARNLEHPRWAEVADRCVACGNCTLVCPTCFCSDVSDTSDLFGEVRRTRTWASCFDLEHSHLAGGSVRTSTSSRYRQWLTHKLSTWWDQFDTSGCVGCGRCIAWCPVGIDLTEEVAAIAATDGAPSVAPHVASS